LLRVISCSYLNLSYWHLESV